MEAGGGIQWVYSEHHPTTGHLVLLSVGTWDGEDTDFGEVGGFPGSRVTRYDGAASNMHVSYLASNHSQGYSLAFHWAHK